MSGSVLAGIRASGVVRSAGALMGSTVVTSVLGFGFWTVAAWTASAPAVGEAAAAIALMTLLGSLATCGFDALLIGELNRRQRHRLPLVIESFAITASLSAGVAVAVVAVVRTLAPDAVALVGGWWGAALFVAGCVAATMAQLIDAVFVGMHRSAGQLRRNTVASVAKLVVLVALAGTGTVAALGIFASWLLGTVASAVVVVRAARGRSRRLWGRWTSATRGLWGSAVGHHAISIAGQVSLDVMPVIVAGSLGAAVNARFYVALQIATFAWLVPLHLATALFAVSAADISRVRTELRMTLWLSGAVTVVVAGGALTLGPTLLGVFGDEYRGASTAIAIFALATFPIGMMGLFITSCRVTGRLAMGASVLLAESVLQIAGGWALAPHGIEWIAVGVVAPTWVVAGFAWRRVAAITGGGPVVAPPAPVAS